MSPNPGMNRHEPPHLPTVSVVIPTYNAVNTIRRALDSVLAQTYEAITEIIVVDDGSEDETPDFVRTNYPDARVIEQENAGAAAARNTGVAAATGEYVAFLDDDDEWFPKKTEVQMSCFRKCPGLRMTLTEIVLVKDDRPRPVPSNDAEGDSGGWLLEPLTFSGCFPTVPFHYGCSGWVFDRALFEECGPFGQLRRRQDREWLWRALFLGFSIAFVRRPLYHYYGADFRRTPEERADFARAWYAVLPSVLEDFAERATEPPALLSEEEATEKRAEFYRIVAWGLWELDLRDEARTCLTRSAELSDARGLKGMRERLAADNPALYQKLSAIVGFASRG